MADPRAVISLDFDHNEAEKNLFVGQSKNSKTPFSIQDWSAKSSMPQSQWEAIVKEKINKSNMLIVLVGKTMVLPVTLFWTKTLVAVKLNWTDQGMVT